MGVRNGLRRRGEGGGWGFELGGGLDLDWKAVRVGMSSEGFGGGWVRVGMGVELGCKSEQVGQSWKCGVDG